MMEKKDLTKILKKLQSEIIDRKWAEKKSKDALDYAESILDSVHIPIIVIDEEYKIISMNQPCSDLFCFSIEDCLGKLFFKVSEGIFDIDSIQRLVHHESSETLEIDLSENFRIIGKKYLHIKCINLQYNIKHLNFKLLVFNDVTDLKNAMNESETKNLMMNEIHHRTINNLFMIDGILKLQLKNAKNEETKFLLTDNITRIGAISNIHKLLMQTNDDYFIDLETMILGLIENVKFLNNNEVEFLLDLEKVSVHYEKSVYLAIIINEFITNSYKHAFNESQENPTIRISLTESSSKLVQLNYSDNGKVKKEDLDLDESLGFKYIENIIQSKLHGNWEGKFSPSLCHEIRFPNMQVVQ